MDTQQVISNSSQQDRRCFHQYTVCSGSIPDNYQDIP